MWEGSHDNPAVCGQCGVQILPKLLADSLQLPRVGAYETAKRALDKVQIAYWEAIAFRLSKDMEATRR
jgi:hypothetical protein